MIQPRAQFFGMLLCLSILAGCSSSGGGGGSTAAPTVTLTASPSDVLAGQGSTLQITSTNATQGSIDNGVGQSGVNNTLVVTPTATTNYTVTVTGPGGSATASAKVTVAPINSFDGMPEDSTNTGTQDIDPNGAVGTQQFMEYVNTEYQAYAKVSPYAPVWPAPQQIGTPWSGPPATLNGPALTHCDGTKIQLDAVINFDRLAQRWVIAAKAANAIGNGDNDYYFCIAVSNTANLASTSPALGWYAYEYLMDTGKNLENHNYFPDWPKLGTWPDAYFATMDLQDRDSFSAEVGVAVCAFDRTSILAGNTTLTPQCIKVLPSTLSAAGTYLGHSLIPADLDGATPPPAGRDEFIVGIENPDINSLTDLSLNPTTSTTLNLWDFHLDWTTPANTTLTLTSPSPTVTAYTPGCYNFVGGLQTQVLTNCATEPPVIVGGVTVPQEVDSVGDRLMPRFAYRNFGTYESYLVSQTVQTGPGAAGAGPNPLFQTGIRWYEFRDNLSGTPAVYQQGTINPDAVLFRFLPSIAQDKVGNAAVAYNVSNIFTNPGINFSFWDLNTANAPSAELSVSLNGTLTEEYTPTTGNGKWGSYSSMTVDPVDDCTFWYVNEYWVLPPGQSDPTLSTWATRITNFKMPTCN